MGSFQNPFGFCHAQHVGKLFHFQSDQLQTRMCKVIKTTPLRIVRILRRIKFLIVREDLVQAALSVLLAIVSVPTLKTLEFWLDGALD